MPVDSVEGLCQRVVSMNSVNCVSGLRVNGWFQPTESVICAKQQCQWILLNSVNEYCQCIASVGCVCQQCPCIVSMNSIFNVNGFCITGLVQLIESTSCTSQQDQWMLLNTISGC